MPRAVPFCQHPPEAQAALAHHCVVLQREAVHDGVVDAGRLGGLNDLGIGWSRYQGSRGKLSRLVASVLRQALQQQL